MLHQAIWWYPSFSQALRQYQAWHGLLVSKIQELQEICCRTIGDMGKNIGGIGRFYTNYRKHRRSCQACSTHPLVTFLSRKSFFLSEVKVFRSSKFTFCFLKNSKLAMNSLKLCESGIMLSDALSPGEKYSAFGQN